MPNKLDWSRVDKTDTCWSWTGSVNGSGYGPHRDAYREQIYGPMHPKLYVLHHCDNPRCLRLDHLFQGTQSDNMKDMRKKGRQGQPFRWTKENHPHLPMSDVNKRAMSQRKRKPFAVTAPDGVVIHGDNLTQFCRDHGLNQGGMWSVIAGKIPSHKGYHRLIPK